MNETIFRMWCSRWLAVIGVVLVIWLGTYFTGLQEDAEQASKERDEQLLRAELIVISAPVAILMYDEDGRITACNPGVEHLLGWNHDDLCTDNIIKIIPVDERANYRYDMAASIKTARRRGENWIYRTTGVTAKALHKDGSLVDVIMSVRVIKYGNNVEFITSLREPVEPERRDEFPVPEDDLNFPAQRALDN